MDTFCFVTNFNLEQSKFLSNVNKIKTKNISIKKEKITTLNNLCELDEQLLFGMISF